MENYNLFAGNRKLNEGGIAKIKGYQLINRLNTPKIINKMSEINIPNEAILSLPLPNNLAIITGPIIINAYRTK